MATYKTSDYAVSTVYGLLSSLTDPRYLWQKPTEKPGDTPVTKYTVINALTINADVMQKCIVNVNYHCRDLAPGIPDLVSLRAGEAAILAILKKATGTGYMIDLENQETFGENQEHYSNLRFSFKNINT